MLSFKLVVRVKDQEADLFQEKKFLRTYRISTSSKGLGCEIGSNKTPPGLLRVAKKIGDGCPIGTVFRSRAATGEFWSLDPTNPLCHTEEDLILSRILWLEGCEEHNLNTFDRYVYLHGTNQEHLLGTPASHGCIRFSNQEIQEIFEILPVGTLVEIVP